MGTYATKSFFEKKLEEYTKSGDKYFEVTPAPDCCPKCADMANKKILIRTASKDDIPPFHSECRCSILPLDDDQEPGFSNNLKDKYDSGIYPMKRCPSCSQWIEGNAVKCKHCNKNML
jgi:hypothetical protein